MKNGTRRWLAVGGVMAASVVVAQQYAGSGPNDLDAAAQDPPNRVVRIAIVQGNASLEPAGVTTFSQAELNYPMAAGDRIYVDNDSLAELQTASLAVRLGNGADVTISTLTDSAAQLGLAQGSIRVRTRDLLNTDGSPGATVEIDTPNGAVLVRSPGDIRIDSYPQDDSTVVTVSSGLVEIAGPNLDQMVGPNQSMRLAGSEPVRTEFVQLLQPDGLDQFDISRENAWANAADIRNGYVQPGMIGVSDLDAYGDWTASPDYSEVWYPRNVSIDWAPYRNGHWAWVAPWGWTWVEAEPWGFAPFHYGRWVVIEGRWGWVPGPPPTVFGRPVRPVYSPALVVFVGGSRAGVTAWFPLGPREAYVPWYHASPGYVNRVNVTNIYTRDTVQVRNVYVNRSSNVYTVKPNEVTYTNRQAATSALAQRDFAAGQKVNMNQQARLDANTRTELATAPVLPHPLVTPAAGTAAPQIPARSLPPSRERPVVQSRGSQPGDSPVAQPPGGSGPRKPIAPSTPSAAPSSASVTSAVPPRQSAPSTPAPAFPRVREQPPVAGPSTPNPAPPPAPSPGAVSAGGLGRPSPPTLRSPDQPRALINRSEPQPAQPSFEVQRRAIEQNDPGRPLGPQQVENLRNNRPAGPPTQAEPVAHPAPPPPKPPASKTADRTPEKPHL